MSKPRPSAIWYTPSVRVLMWITGSTRHNRRHHSAGGTCRKTPSGKTVHRNACSVEHCAANGNTEKRLAMADGREQVESIKSTTKPTAPSGLSYKAGKRQQSYCLTAVAKVTILLRWPRSYLGHWRHWVRKRNRLLPIYARLFELGQKLT